MLFFSLPSECQGMCSSFRCPSFRLPWSTPPALQPSVHTSGQTYSSAVTVERLKEAGSLAWNARIAWVVIHGTLIGALFIFDTPLSRALKEGDYWYLGSYSTLVFLTIVEYYITSGSSPGYVQDVLEAVENAEEAGSQNEISESLLTVDVQVDALPRNFSESSSTEPLLPTSDSSSLSTVIPTLPKSASFQQRVSAFLKWHNERQIARPNPELLRRTDSNRRCPYCQIWQPMRTKHCHDCDKCVLRFDHHCFWVGTCIGQRNHFRFWWYLFFESVLVCWTFIISLSAFSRETRVDMWILHTFLAFFLAFTLFALAAFLVVLLGFHTYLVLTNQTTYETTRRTRISYLRHVPEKVHPFSKGLWQNIYSFCCTPSTVYPNYELPQSDELEKMAQGHNSVCNPEYFKCCI